MDTFFRGFFVGFLSTFFFAEKVRVEADTMQNRRKINYIKHVFHLLLYQLFFLLQLYHSNGIDNDFFVFILRLCYGKIISVVMVFWRHHGNLHCIFSKS